MQQRVDMPLLVSFRALLLATATFLWPSSTVAESKPANEPSLDALCQVASIVEAEYENFERDPKAGIIDYFHPPLAKFKFLRLVHGKAVPAEFFIFYSFDDGSACLMPEGWKFSEDLLPKPGSRWFLFLTEGQEKLHKTYYGDFGRFAPGSLARHLISRCAKAWQG